MSECTCHKNYTLDTLIPKVGIITDIRQETPDVKTFRVNAPDGGKLFELHLSSFPLHCFSKRCQSSALLGSFCGFLSIVGDLYLTKHFIVCYLYKHPSSTGVPCTVGHTFHNRLVDQ